MTAPYRLTYIPLNIMMTMLKYVPLNIVITYFPWKIAMKTPYKLTYVPLNMVMTATSGMNPIEAENKTHPTAWK